MGSGETLALNGGSRAVTSGYRERWPLISEEDVNRAARMMIDGELSISDGSGVLEEFEGEFARYHGVPYALVQNNGTSALHAAYFAVGVGPGDEVLVPTYTWPSTANAALTCNATPVFCDVDPETLCIDPRRDRAQDHPCDACHRRGAPVGPARRHGRHPGHRAPAPPARDRGLLARARRHIQGPQGGSDRRHRLLQPPGEQDDRWG